MTYTPKNMPTETLVGLFAAPIITPTYTDRPELHVQVYDYKAWCWNDATDAEIIAQATTAAQPKVQAWNKVGEVLYVGDLITSDQTKQRVRITVR